MYDVRFMDMAYEDYDAISEYLSQFYPGTPGKFLAELEKSTATLEPSASGQIQAMCDQPAMSGSKIRIMPDVHAGKGCTIGTTMTIGSRGRW